MIPPCFPLSPARTHPLAAHLCLFFHCFTMPLALRPCPHLLFHQFGRLQPLRVEALDHILRIILTFFGSAPVTLWSEDFVEGLEACAEKQVPQWKGR